MSKSTPEPQSIPYGYCQCGCGERTGIAKVSRVSAGLIKGEPVRYISGHNRRVSVIGGNRIEIDNETGIARVYLINRVDTGRYTTVDSSDLEKISVIRWRLDERGFYAIGACRGGGDVRLHRFILDLKTGDSREVDHADGNGLNNTRGNLRLCSRAQNMRNTRKQIGCTSQFKGVSWDRRKGMWYAKITKSRKQMNLGLFEIEEDAARAYDDAARSLFGEFARLNFPDR